MGSNPNLLSLFLSLPIAALALAASLLASLRELPPLRPASLIVTFCSTFSTLPSLDYPRELWHSPSAMSTGILTSICNWFDSHYRGLMLASMLLELLLLGWIATLETLSFILVRR